MDYLKILNTIKKMKKITKYIVLDARVIGGNSSTGDIIKLNLKKVIKDKVVEKEIFIHPTYRWEEELYVPTGVTSKEARRGVTFKKAYSQLIDFTKDLIVIANQAYALNKTFVKNCKRANIHSQNILWLDAFFLSRLAFPKEKYRTIGGFADFLQIPYNANTIAQGYNIVNLIDKVSIRSIHEIIKFDKKPKPFMDYERNLSDAKMRLYSRITIFLMLIGLMIFLGIQL